MAKFSDILTIINGKNQNKVENPDGKYPIYGSGGIMGYADDYLCEAGTVVIGRKGSINKPIFVEEPFWNVDTAFGLAANRNKILPKYLFYFCVNFDFEKLNTTVTIPSLTKANLLEIEMEVPQLDEQERIVEKLSKIDALISLRKQQLAKLDELVKARFVELFGGGNDNSEPLKSFLEDITYGFTNPMPDAEEGPWKVTAKDVVNGKVNYDTARKTTIQAFEELTAKSKPTVGNVLLTKDGTLGRCAVVEEEGICVNQSVAVLKCNKRILPKFLAILLQMPEYQREMLKNAGGGTIKHIYITKVVDMLIVVPTISQQMEFLSFVEQTDKSKLTVQQSLDKLELLKKSLMQQYFG